jgi:hypothetical protein
MSLLRLLVFFALGVIAFGEGVAAAQPVAAPSAQPPDRARIEQAKRLFKAGARAYQAGRFLVAAQAFEEAHDLAPQPELRFSAAQALRRQYTLAQDPRLLDKALGYYREYIDKVRQGGRVLEATEAVNEIQVLRAGPEAKSGEPAVIAPPAAKPTGTVVVDSTIDGLSVRVGRRRFRGSPPIFDLPGGVHLVRIEAKGYVSRERRISVVAGGLYPLDGNLDERAAELSIEGLEDAEVLVDGRPEGRLPMVRPIEEQSGKHHVVVGHAGYGVFTAAVTLKRGERRKLEASMRPTAQRVAAWILFGGAATTLATGVVLAGMAFAEQREAQKIDEITESGRALTSDEAVTRNDHLDRRDDFVRIGAGAFALGGLGAGIGLLLFVLDEPDIYGAAAEAERAGDRPKPKRTKPPSERLELSLSPLGLSLHGNF